MTVYVDPLMAHGWIMRGREVPSCHPFTDQVDLSELHRLARMIGCKPEWFQEKACPHYDLTVLRRQEAIGCGAIAVTRRQAVEIWRARRAELDAMYRAVQAEKRRCTCFQLLGRHQAPCALSDAASECQRNGHCLRPTGCTC